MNKISITFPDNSVREFDSGITPFEIASSISRGLADKALVAKVDGKLTELTYSYK